MNPIRSIFKSPLSLACALTAVFFIAGCGGSNQDPVLGTPGEVVTLPAPVVPVVPVVPVDVTRPTVVQTIPASGETNVPINRSITAVLSEDMAPATISASSFTVTNTTSSTAVAGTVTYSQAARTATFTPSAVLPNASAFSATITTAATDLAGNGLAGSAAALPNASDHTWNFTTGLAPDTTRPTVAQTVPAPDQTDVPPSQPVTAQFSENMSPGTIPGSFTLTDTETTAPVDGVAEYAVGSRTVTFTPTSALPFDRSFTATISPAATDLANNALVGNAAPLPNAGSYSWSFTTGAAPDTTPPTVFGAFPGLGTSACATNAIIVEFTEAMTAASVNQDTFLVTVNGAASTGTVDYYDPSTFRARFVTTNGVPFPTNSAVGITVKSGADGVKDAAGNAMQSDFVSGFTAGSQSCLTGPNLGAARLFAGFGGTAGMTNQGILTVINGDVGSTSVCSAMTGFHDADDNLGETPLNVGTVNGSIHCAPPPASMAASILLATQALADAELAYAELAAQPNGSAQGPAGELGGLTLTPGVYTASDGSYSITIGDLTLDALGDPNAVWVFQAATSLTVGETAGIRNVVLTGGADARNVYWQVGSAARIENGSSMVGTIIARAGVTFSTAGQVVLTTLQGRAIGLDASVTMVNTVITVPPEPASP